MLFCILIFILIYIFIYFKVLIKKEKIENLKVSTMYVYLVLVLFVTILPIDFTLDLKLKTYVHLKPFNDLIMGYRNALKQIILNVIMTIPFGFLCCILKNSDTIFKVTMKTFLLSFTIEFIQLVMTVFLLHHRSCDITDLITNVAGGIIGFLLYKLIRNIFCKRRIIILWTKNKY